MSETQSGLKPLSKEDLKELKKQAEREKRNEQAMTARIDPVYTVPNQRTSVSFTAPVKIASNDDNDDLNNVLGDYKDFSSFLSQSTRRVPDIVGIERQPATPLPNKRFFSKTSENSGDVRSRNVSSGRHRAPTGGTSASGSSASSDTNRLPSRTKVESSHNASGDSVKPKSSQHSNSVPPSNRSAVHSANSENSNSSLTSLSKSHRTEHQRAEHPRTSSQSSTNKSHSSVSGQSQHREHSKPDEVKKETPVTQPSKHPPISSREPVLQSLNQELIGQSKSEPLKSSSKPVSSSNNSVKNSSDSKVSSDPRAVLKEKEENRNINGGKIRARPRLTIPENVEEMLQEFTSGVPQPVTAIQTPYKESKFPFQDKAGADLVTKDSGADGGSAPVRARPVLQRSPGRAGSEVAAGVTRVVEEIAEPSSSGSDSSSEGSGDEESGPDTSDEEGQHDHKHNTASADKQPESISKPEPAQKVAPAPTPAQASSQSAPGARSTLVPEKTLKGMKSVSSGSSGESSSSDSSGSESGSDSDSDHEHDEPRKPDPATWPHGAPEIPTSQSGKWSLQTFLSKDTTPSMLNANPPSDKSEDLDEVEKRAADQVISDENPPSNDRDAASKRCMSADEFSPPAPIDKHPILSPIKSPQPVKSPAAKRSHSRGTAAQKLQQLNTAGRSSENVKFPNTYDHVKNRERKPSLSKASPSLSDCDKASLGRKSRGRKPKQKAKSQEYVDSNSESESEIDVVNSSHSSHSDINSPYKSLPTNLKKSQTKASSLSGSPARFSGSNLPVTSSVKRKDSKRDKLLKDEDSIKLKADCSTGVPEKLANCDNSKAASKGSSSAFTDPIDQLLGSFSGAKPLSPIRDMTHDLKKAGLMVSTIKPFTHPLNGSISSNSGKPSVLVRLDLNNLSNYLCIDQNSANFLKPHRDFAVKHQKVQESAKSSPPNVQHSRKLLSNKVLHDNVPDKVSKSLSSRVSPSSQPCERTSGSNSSHSVKLEKSNDRVAEPSGNSSRKSSSNLSSLGVHNRHDSATDSGIPDFDSLPVSEAKDVPVSRLSEDSGSESSSGDSSSSDSSGSGSESETDHEHEDVYRKQEHASPVQPVTSKPVTQPPARSIKSPGSAQDVKKRKLDSSHEEDPKRRKTAVAKATQKRPAEESTHNSEAEAAQTDGRPVVSVKRERRSSVSSQHSTTSNLSQASTSSRHKRGRSGAGANLRPTATLASTSDGGATGQEPRHAAQGSASAAPVSGTSASSSGKQGRLEPPESLRPVNGYVPTGDGATQRSRPVTGYSLLAHKQEEERLKSSDEYHRQAKKYKYQADDMEPGLMKHVLYVESALCFLESGLAMERDRAISDAYQMFKDTFKFVMHQYNQLNREAQRKGLKPEQKLAVLCQRIQSLLYMKLFTMKKQETINLKRAIDDPSKGGSVLSTSSQPKLPSAPSPHQTNWNRSTGTPSPMSPTPSPANSVCSVGSVGSDQTPSKLTNGTGPGGGQGSHGQPPGSVVVPQRIHSITQKYISNTAYLVSAHLYWDQADDHITADIRDFFIELDHEIGPLTLHSSLQHLLRYLRLAIKHLNV